MKNKNLEKKIGSLFEIGILVLGIFAFAFIVGDFEMVGALGTSEEELGCCFDGDEGLCDPNVVEENCQVAGGSWFDDPLCQVGACRIGCCSLGLNTQFVTQRRCEKLSELFGTPGNWDPSIEDDLECMAVVDSGEIGACVIPIPYEETNNCKFTTKTECLSITNDLQYFHEGYLCSNEELNTICEKQKSAGCIEGEEEIYWFDSCGNRENIYSSNKLNSWNEGKVLSKQDSCNPNSANSRSSSCGNCNYELGSICREFGAGDKGNMEGFTCRDLNCDDAPGHAGRKKDRINGESWCVYDGQIGNLGIGSIGALSVDPVGSRHFRYACVNGEVKVEPCADYRKEICVEDEKEVEGIRKINNAMCRVNTWEQCVAANSGGDCGPGCMAKCALNPDCSIQPIFVDSEFKFNMCVPKYPPGFDLESTSGLVGVAGGIAGDALGDLGVLGEFGDIAGGLGGFGGGTSANNVCGLASKTCSVMFVKKCPGGWTCVENCNCMNAGFTAQMNNLCASLGDCGAYINYVGKPTFFGASVSKKGSHGHRPPPPAFFAPLYAVLAIAVRGQHAKPGGYDSVESILSLPLGMADSFLSGYASFGDFEEGSQLGNMFGDQLGSTLTGAGIGAGVGAVGGILAGGAGLFGAGATYSGLSIGGIFIGATPLGFAVLGAVIVMGAMYAMGCGKTEIVEISFDCKTWQRPFMGNCKKCNENPMKPCSKYRCESLGMNCGMINEGTEYGVCASINNEDNIPTISPWEEILNRSLFRYQSETTNGFEVRDSNGNCIQAFTPLIFGVETDVYAQCRISQERDFEESDWSYFFERNVLTKNHTYATYLPSAESLIASQVSTPEEFEELMEAEITEENAEDMGIFDDDIEQHIGDTIHEYLLDQVGELNFYVKCANINGIENDHDYQINFCVAPGPDRTAPVVTLTMPADGAILPVNATEQETIIFVNEPAECKWDVIRPITGDMLEAYRYLENEMECETNVNSGTILGYSCSANLPVEENENSYYILCRDQPWLGENSSRNIGAELGGVYEYNLKKSEFELKIDSIEPNETITRGTEPISVELRVETSGGVDNGNASCSYEFKEQGFSDRFSETWDNNHRHILASMTKGDYEFEVKCNDAVGNFAEKESSFSLELDEIGPEVTRVYHDSGNLVVVTNEDSRCYFNTDSRWGCNFNLQNANLMNGENSKIHTTIWESDVTHYIICEDNWSNRFSGCSIIVQPDDSIA